MDNIMLDRMYMFLTLWYYCTLTIRESILRVNGTRIKVGDLKMNIQFQLSIYFLKYLVIGRLINWYKQFYSFRDGGELIILCLRFWEAFFSYGPMENVFKHSGRNLLD